MAHPLDGAFERVTRAEEHLLQLHDAITDFRAVEEKALISQIDAQIPEEFIFGSIRTPLPPRIPRAVIESIKSPPLRLGIFVGEICYNLRAALDYLVYELACNDSGAVQEGTQFPIEDTYEGFRAHAIVGRPSKRGRGVPPLLNGLNCRHIALIQGLQPCNGCKWTKTLRDISNPDKHRHLTATVPDHMVLAYVARSTDALKRWQGLVRRAPMPDGSVMYVQHHPTIFVTFPDGTQVAETLEEVKSSVAETLRDFQTEF